MNKAFAHKSKSHNVFIEDIEAALPQEISEAELEIIQKAQAAKGLEIIRRAYQEPEALGKPWLLGSPGPASAAAVAHLLREAGISLPETEWIARIRIPLGHDFFFEHAVEHLPGMFILEAARQMMISCWHIYGGIPLEGYAFSMNRFDSQFIDYIDLHIPSEIRLRLHSFSGSAEKWKEVDFEYAALQAGRICVKGRTTARLISTGLLQRLRSPRKKIHPANRFALHSGAHASLRLIQACGEGLEARLLDLSLGGCACRFDSPSPPSGIEPRAALTLLFKGEEEELQVRGTCTWTKSDTEGSEAGFSLHTESEAEAALKKIILSRFILKEGR